MTPTEFKMKSALKTDKRDRGEGRPEGAATPLRHVTVTLPTENWRAEPERCKLCPRTCYTHNCVCFNAVFTCLGMLASAGAFIGLMSTSVRPHLTSLSYVNGTCKTVNYTWTGKREGCACVKKGQKNCRATYPCLQVWVEYVTKGQVITSMMHEEEHTFTYRPRCSYQPKRCSEGYNPNSVANFFNKWAIPGTVYPCFHNPVGLGALRDRTRGVPYVIHMIFWPAFFTILFFVLFLVIYCYCIEREIE